MSDIFCGWSPSMLQTCRLKFHCSVYIYIYIFEDGWYWEQHFTAWQQSKASRVNVELLFFPHDKKKGLLQKATREILSLLLIRHFVKLQWFDYNYSNIHKSSYSDKLKSIQTRFE